MMHKSQKCKVQGYSENYYFAFHCHCYRNLFEISVQLINYIFELIVNQVTLYYLSMSAPFTHEEEVLI